MHIYNRIIRRISRIDRKLIGVCVFILTALSNEWSYIVPRWLSAAITTTLAILAYLEQQGERDTMCQGPHPYIPAPNVSKVELIYTVLGETVENVLHFSTVSVLDTFGLIQLCVDTRTAWEANLKPLLSVSAALVKIRATDLTTETGPSVEFTATLPQNGGNSNPVTNGAQTLATKLSTTGRGRSMRGRIYNVGIIDSAVTGNAVSGTFATQITNGWIGFRDDMLAATQSAIMVVVSYCGNGVWRTEAQISTVTDISTDIYIDSQRRRLHGRGQ